MATVWIADDPVLSRRVAVKVLRADLAADDATRARFRNEAIAAARLSHPNIVSTYDTGDDDGIAYIVMELVDGPTLRHLIDEHGGLPVADVIRIGKQVADALDAAHRAGLVHRDVKPANVLVPRAGPVKVTDFGIAKAAGADDLTRTGTVMGTARYLAPEQVNGRPTDPRTDVYALGLLMFEALVGHPPFGGDTDIATAMARLTTSAPSIRAERPEVSQALDDVIHRCLARQPAARFGSAAAVRDALDRARLDPTGAHPAAGRAHRDGPGRAPPPPRRHPPRTPGRPAHSPTPLPAPAPRRGGAGGSAGCGSCSSCSSRSPAASLAYVLVSDGSSSSGANRTGASSAPSTATRRRSRRDRLRPARRRDRGPRRGAATPSTATRPRAGRPSSTSQLPRRRQERRRTQLRPRRRRTTCTRSSSTTQQDGWGASIYVSDKPRVRSCTTLDDWGDAADAGHRPRAPRTPSTSAG